MGNRRFGWAALLGAGAALCRPHGVLLTVSIAVEAGIATRDGCGRRTMWLAPLGPLAGIAGYALWCWFEVGNAFAFAARQERWRGSLSGPWKAFVRWWEAEPVVHGSHGSIVELVLAILVLAALPIIVRRLRPSMSVFAVLSVLVALGSSLWSFGRIMIGVFPIYLAVGYLAVSGRRPLVIALLWAGSSLGAVLMALYAAWWWAG